MIGNVFAQELDSILLKGNYSNPIDYEIGGIKVIGTFASDENAVVAVSGLRVGETLKIPGYQIQQALKGIWKLGLYEDVQIRAEKVLQEIIFLEIILEEQLLLKEVQYRGVKKKDKEIVQKKIQSLLQKGRGLSNQNMLQVKEEVLAYYHQRGFWDAEVNTTMERITSNDSKARILIDVQTGNRVKIAAIEFKGNQHIADRRLKKTFEHLVLKSKLFSKSIYDSENYKADQKGILDLYRSEGYLDAQIIKDSLRRNTDGDIELFLEIKEGTRYYFGDIKWKGNTLYPTALLQDILVIQKGDVFNQKLLEQRLYFDEPRKDISSLYLDNGYLFFLVEPVIYAIEKDTMHLEIRIKEGRPATISKVTISGNSKTYDEVIRRELRTLPGNRFSREDIIRSQREIINLGFFNPEGFKIFTPANPTDGTVEIEYVVEEKSNDQFEMSAGWGGAGNGVVGTIGMSFNNFSLSKFFKPKHWNPVPAGEGQRLSFRLQSSGLDYQSANFSFTEPWLGKKKPNQFNIGGYYNRFTSAPEIEGMDRGRFTITGFSTSFGTRLQWPDDYFVATTAFNFQRLYLKDYDQTLFVTDLGESVNRGQFFNLSIQQTIARNALNHPIFPSKGSLFSFSAQLTPPYSLFSNRKYSASSTQDRFRWLEYHKWEFKGEYYRPLTKKLTLKLAAKMGYLGYYNKNLGLTPFERFQLGGSGTTGQLAGFQGTDLIALRGYEIEDLENNYLDGELVPTPLYQKLTMELRYPLLNNATVPVIGLLFAEAGNSWRSFSDYNPFELKRSVGFGMRAQVPMLGLIGFDYGFGLDKGINNFWKTGKFSIIIGFEPQ